MGKRINWYRYMYMTLYNVMTLYHGYGPKLTSKLAPKLNVLVMLMKGPEHMALYMYLSLSVYAKRVLLTFIYTSIINLRGVLRVAIAN